MSIAEKFLFVLLGGVAGGILINVSCEWLAEFLNWFSVDSVAGYPAAFPEHIVAWLVVSGVVVGLLLAALFVLKSGEVSLNRK